METKEIDLATKEEQAFKLVEGLKKNLDKAKNTYNTQKAEADKLKKERQMAEQWETMLTEYYNAVKNTDELAQDVMAAFGKTSDRALQVCNRANDALEAFKWMLIDIVNMSKCVEEFKCEIDDCVNALSNVSDDDPLMKGLKRLQAAVAEALQCLLDALNQWLAILKMSQHLAKNLGPKSGKILGIVGFETDLRNNFEKEDPHITYSRAKSCIYCEAPPRAAYPFISDCVCPKEKEVTKKLAAIQNMTDYACKTKCELEAIQTCLTGIKKDYDMKAKEMVEAKAKMDALQVAWEIASQTNACKN